MRSVIKQTSNIEIFIWGFTRFSNSDRKSLQTHPPHVLAGPLCNPYSCQMAQLVSGRIYLPLLLVGHLMPALIQAAWANGPAWVI